MIKTLISSVAALAVLAGATAAAARPHDHDRGGRNWNYGQQFDRHDRRDIRFERRDRFDYRYFEELRRHRHHHHHHDHDRGDRW